MTFVLWEILIPLIIAFLLGLLFGWLLWGWRRTKISYTEWETMRQKANRSSSIEAEAKLAELTADRDRLKAQIDSHVCDTGASADLGTGVLGVSGAAAVAAGDDASAAEGSSEAAASGDADAPADEVAAASDDVSADATGDDTVSNDAAASGEGAERAVTGERYPFGEGSHAPFADDPQDQPEGYDIKGNADSMLYHRPDSRVYAATVAEVWFDTAQRAEDNGFALAKSHPKDTVIADADRPVAGGERHPYGEGSHAPFAEDAKIQPEGYEVKGNADSMLYHRTDSRSYKATIAEVWFDTPERAEAAGFALANSHPKAD